MIIEITALDSNPNYEDLLIEFAEAILYEKAHLKLIHGGKVETDNADIKLLPPNQ